MENIDQNLVIGVDVGGQTSKCGIVDARGTVIAQTVIRTDNHDTVEPFIVELSGALKKLIVEAGAQGKIRGIGVGAPNASYYTGDIENAVNLSWGRSGAIHFAALLKDAMGGIPVTLTNDANAAAMGEMTYGAARGMKNFIMITLGTGMARTAREWLEMSDEPSILRKLDNITSKDVYEAAKEGDNLALRVFDYTGTLLGMAFADFIEFSSPEAIVLFGGLARSKEFLTEPIERSMNANVLPLWRGKVKLVYSSLKESDAAILGASALAW